MLQGAFPSVVGRGEVFPRTELSHGLSGTATGYFHEWEWLVRLDFLSLTLTMPNNTRDGAVVARKVEAQQR